MPIPWPSDAILESICLLRLATPELVVKERCMIATATPFAPNYTSALQPSALVLEHPPDRDVIKMSHLVWSRQRHAMLAHRRST